MPWLQLKPRPLAFFQSISDYPHSNFGVSVACSEPGCLNPEGQRRMFHTYAMIYSSKIAPSCSKPSTHTYYRDLYPPKFACGIFACEIPESSGHHLHCVSSSLRLTMLQYKNTEANCSTITKISWNKAGLEDNREQVLRTQEVLLSSYRYHMKPQILSLVLATFVSTCFKPSQKERQHRQPPRVSSTSNPLSITLIQVLHNYTCFSGSRPAFILFTQCYSC